MQRTAAKAACRAADLGQVLSVARRITPGDYASWFAQWFAEGRKEAELARGEKARGHHHNAGEAWLRAHECFRSAYIFARRYPQGAALVAAWRRSRDAFRAALPSLAFPVEAVRIPGRTSTSRAMSCARRRAGAAAPTVLMPCGYDSPVEEFYSLGGFEAALRGFNVVAFSGPGQAEMLYERGIPFRHDFEAVVGPVIDFVERTAAERRRPRRHAHRAGRPQLRGLPRAARRVARAAHRRARGRSGADRHAAAFAKRFPPEWLELLERGDPALNDKVWAAFPGMHGQEFWLSRIRAHGLASPLEYCQEMRRWTVDVEAIALPGFRLLRRGRLRGQARPRPSSSACPTPTSGWSSTATPTAAAAIARAWGRPVLRRPLRLAAGSVATQSCWSAELQNLQRCRAAQA